MWRSWQVQSTSGEAGRTDGLWTEYWGRAAPMLVLLPRSAAGTGDGVLGRQMGRSFWDRMRSVVGGLVPNVLPLWGETIIVWYDGALEHVALLC